MSDDRQGCGTNEGAESDGFRRPRWRPAHVVGGVVFSFCAFVFYLTTKFDAVPVAVAQGVPPTFFPRIVILILAVLTAVMLFQSRFVPAKSRKPKPAMVYITAAVLTVIVVAIEWLGIIAAVMMLCVIVPILWGERRYLPLLVYAAIFPFIAFFLFSGLLGVRFPVGLVESFLY